MCVCVCVLLHVCLCDACGTLAHASFRIMLLLLSLTLVCVCVCAVPTEEDIAALRALKGEVSVGADAYLYVHKLGVKIGEKGGEAFGVRDDCRFSPSPPTCVSVKGPATFSSPLSLYFCSVVAHLSSLVFMRVCRFSLSSSHAAFY